MKAGYRRYYHKQINVWQHFYFEAGVNFHFEREKYWKAFDNGTRLINKCEITSHIIFLSPPALTIFSTHCWPQSRCLNGNTYSSSPITLTPTTHRLTACYMQYSSSPLHPKKSKAQLQNLLKSISPPLEAVVPRPSRHKVRTAKGTSSWGRLKPCHRNSSKCV